MITDRIDVFLSRKSQDAHLAKEVYDFLTSKGLQVFDSDHSLLEMGNSDYSRAIDDALAKTNHLIVIGSSVQNITSSWVEAEWRFFLNRKRANKTKGNILTVVTKTVAIDDLPPSLQNYEVIPFEQKNQKILPYVMVGHIKTEIVEEKVIEPVETKVIDYTSLSDIELQQKANEGIAEAQYLLGVRHNKKEIYSVALRWYLKAAEQNNSDAQNAIGVLYYYGKGVKQDKEIANEWFLKAAKQGNETAKNWLIRNHNSKEVNNSSRSQINLTENKPKKQRKEFPNEYLVLGLFLVLILFYIALKKDKKANATLGYISVDTTMMVDTAMSVDTAFSLPIDNSVKTIDYVSLSDTELEQKANEGIAKAQNLMGRRNDKKEDYAQAMQWYLKAAEQGNAPAQYNIGCLYDYGRGVKQNYQQAMQWYLKAAEQGDADAQTNIGFLYDKGHGVSQDYKEAMQWYLKADERNNSSAQNNIGALYYYGRGVDKSKEIAKEWFLKAARQGDITAKEWLKDKYGITDY